MLRQFVDWGALPENVAGIDLSVERVAKAQRLSPDLDIRCGSASALPWPDGSFDLVCQHTVFSSILDAGMRRQVAREMTRVAHAGGAVLWYDFMFDNPSNPDVRAMRTAEIRELFPGMVCRLRRITLVPPISRRLPAPLLPIAYPLLAWLPPVRSHLLGLLLKPGIAAMRAPVSDQVPMLASTSRT
jgi:hypothetical protein